MTKSIINISLVLYLLMVFTCSSSKMSGNGNMLYGDWIVYKYEPGNITELTTSEADELVGSMISITPTGDILAFNNRCNECSCSQKNILVEDYFDTFNIDYKSMDLKIKEPILHTCMCKENEQKTEIKEFDFLENGKELIYVKGGFFFYLKNKSN